MHRHPAFLDANEQARIWQRSSRRRFASAPGRHAELVVLLGLVGEATYFLDGRTLKLRAQSVLFCPPGEAHFLISETPDFDMVVAVFSTESLKAPPIHPSFDGQTGPSHPRLRTLSTPHHQEVVRLATQLIKAEPEAMLAGVGWWLHRLWTNSQALDLEDDAVHPKVMQAAELLYADPGIALVDLADRVDLTPTRIGQLFRAQTGMTLRAFRAERRFEAFHALQASNPDMTLLSAALEAGFGDYSSFYRAYRQRYGRKPRSTGDDKA